MFRLLLFSLCLGLESVILSEEHWLPWWIVLSQDLGARYAHGLGCLRSQALTTHRPRRHGCVPAFTCTYTHLPLYLFLHLYTYIQGGAKVGLQLWVHKPVYSRVIFHRNNYKSTFAPLCIAKQEFILIPPILVQNCKVYFSFFPVLKKSLQPREIWLPLPWTDLFIYSILSYVASLLTSLVTAPLRCPPGMDLDTMGPPVWSPVLLCVGNPLMLAVGCVTSLSTIFRNWALAPRGCREGGLMFKSWPSNPHLGEKTFAGESELDSCARPGTDGATGLSNKKEMLQMVIRW